ncbi:protein of unknown function [Acidithiobacillus ferrivorans]|uniref:Uncharacterized protein n=1 Tax=Acidithiobacillus ferrivorans TaxID=160808 RepID=A0ABY1MK63_9PROT|nr:protein of unknown function [Acidithiobacillus ferrivorans]
MTEAPWPKDTMFESVRGIYEPYET